MLLQVIVDDFNALLGQFKGFRVFALLPQESYSQTDEPRFDFARRSLCEVGRTFLSCLCFSLFGRRPLLRNIHGTVIAVESSPVHQQGASHGAHCGSWIQQFRRRTRDIGRLRTGRGSRTGAQPPAHDLDGIGVKIQDLVRQEPLQALRRGFEGWQHHWGCCWRLFFFGFLVFFLLRLCGVAHFGVFHHLAAGCCAAAFELVLLPIGSVARVRLCFRDAAITMVTKSKGAKSTGWIFQCCSSAFDILYLALLTNAWCMGR